MCNANGFGSVKIVMKSSISFEMRRTERFCFSVFQLLPGRARRVSDAFVLSRPNYVLLEFSDSLLWLAGASFSRFCDGIRTLCAVCVVNIAVAVLLPWCLLGWYSSLYFCTLIKIFFWIFLPLNIVVVFL